MPNPDLYLESISEEVVAQIGTRISRNLQIIGPKYDVDARVGFVHSIDEKNG